MRKQLVKEVQFGKATAKVTVTMFTEKVRLDGQETGNEKVNTVKEVEIVAPNGKVVEKGNVTILEYNNLTDALYNKFKLDANKKYTKVGDRAITEGEETGIAIQNAIDELEKELAAEFEVKTNKEVEQEKQVKEAQTVVEMAEREGIDNLMSAAEIKTWRKKYNNLHNEGGEGYIPDRISKERYQQALKVLNGKEII